MFAWRVLVFLRLDTRGLIGAMKFSRPKKPFRKTKHKMDILLPRTSWPQRSRVLIATALAAFALSSTQAKFDMDIDNFRGAIGVAPAVSDVGTPRTITVNAVWPNACPPTFHGAGMELGINPTTFILRFIVPATLVACAQVETPFSATTTFTPTRDGDFNVVALTVEDGRILARGKMLTLPADAPGSDNLSGVWVGEQATSIAMLTHSEGSSDALVGSWNLFARDGTARWQFLHSSRRTASNTFEAELHDFSVPVNSGACGNSACPMPGLTGRNAGSVKMTIEKDDVLMIEVFSTAAAHPNLPVGTLLFKTQLTRLKLP
jgi:hypothetical protein